MNHYETIRKALDSMKCNESHDGCLRCEGIASLEAVAQGNAGLFDDPNPAISGTDLLDIIKNPTRV